MIEWFLGLALYWQIPLGFVGFIFSILIFLFIVATTWGCVWAIFYPASKMPCETLKKNHDDWWPGFRWIPRRITAFLNGPDPRKKYPKQLFGTNGRVFIKNGKIIYDVFSRAVIQQDVPGPGTWCVSWPLHFAWLTKGDRIIGFGIRKDYCEDYWTARFCFHKNS